MKRLINLFYALALLVIVGPAVSSCVREQGPQVAKAVLGDVSQMKFAAKNPQPQLVTVYSDGPWHTKAPSWITVDPKEGDGVVAVTVTATENVDGGGMLEPRKDTVIISGNTLASRLIILVSQEGDAYRNAEHLALDKIAGLKDGQSFILDEATVAALSANGCIVSDGTSNVYITSASGVAVGDKVSVKGIKGTVNGVPAITETAEIKTLSSGSFVGPEAVDITEQLASFDGSSLRYVLISGIVANGNLAVVTPEATYAVKQVDSPDGLAFSTLNGHKAQVKGYTCGILGANMFGIIATELIDKGIDQVIYFEDDFEWVAPWATAAGAGDAIAANDPSTTAPNVFTSAACDGFLAEFAARGYGYYEGKQDLPWTDVTADNVPGKVLYLQSNYLKFGKSDWNSGITLPAISAIEGTDNVFLEFDWCWQVTGGYKPDLMTLTVEIVGNGICTESGDVLSVPIESEQIRVDGESKIEWQHAKVALNGIDKDTRIKIRPTNYDPYIENPARGQNRWYLDNIKVTPGEGSSGGGGGGEKSFGTTWSFDPEKTYEAGKDYEVNQSTGSWLLSDDGLGKLSVNRVSGVDASKISTFTTDETWGTKVYRLLSYSVYLDDYWMFEMNAPKHPAGKCNIKFCMSSSAAGPKVFVMEYSTDGENWTAFNTKKTEIVINKDGETPYEVTYTYILSPDYPAANECCEIDQTFDLPASIIEGPLYVRARVNDTIVNDRSKMLNGTTHGGTNRIGKFASLSFTAN